MTVKVKGAALAAVLLAGTAGGAWAAPLLVVGNDEKLVWNDEGAAVLSAPGKDNVAIFDLADPEAPKLVAALPLKNSVAGPPVNIGVTPDGSLALVADSLNVVEEGGKLKNVPDAGVHVIDLKANPPRALGMVEAGRQPSGLDVSPSGKLALVANRGDGTVSVFSIEGTQVKLTDTVTVGTGADQLSHVAFTPDGRRALAVKFASHKIAVLDISAEGKVSYSKLDLPGGLWPYNVAVAPSGKLALTADNGAAGASDGSVDTVSVIDLTQTPPRVTDKVVVGDGPEGLAISPKGDLAVAAILRGGNAAKSAFFHHPTGTVAILRLDGAKVTKLKDIEVGGLPEPVVFSPDGRYVYVGNYLDKTFTILKVDGTEVTNTGKTFAVPGHPASAKMGPG